MSDKIFLVQLGFLSGVDVPFIAKHFCFTHWRGGSVYIWVVAVGILTITPPPPLNSYLTFALPRRHCQSNPAVAGVIQTPQRIMFPSELDAEAGNCSRELSESIATHAKINQ
jgi:hypothetical protein